MKLFGSKKREEDLPPEVVQLVEEYAQEKGLDFRKALEDLVKKGYRYAQMEKIYGKSVHDREIWDKRFYYLKVEAGYLYYRMRFRDLLEEMRSLSMILLGTVKSLELCYQRYAPKSDIIEKELNELKKLEQTAKRYVEEFVLMGRRELEEKVYADDREILKSIEETLKRYRQEFGLNNE